MGLKSFLQHQGFLKAEDAAGPTGSSEFAATPMMPVIFPMHGATVPMDNSIAAAPDFVQDLPKAAAADASIDPAFVKFYEDEMGKANLPGPDYYEFRQQMLAMSRKLAGKGVSQELMFQTVLASFEAQNVPAAKLVEAANFYKSALAAKKDDFLKGAAAEKNHQLQKRADALQQHQARIDDMVRQLKELQERMRQLEQSLTQEKTQLEVDKTMGKEGIEKIERAGQQIALAFTFMSSAIDRDISLLRA